MKKKILIIICLFLLFVSIASVSATEDVNQTNIEDIDNADTLSVSLSDEDFVGSAKNGTFEDIQNLINNANAGDTILLEGYYSGSGSAITVARQQVTIIGCGDTVLDAKGLSGILSVNTNNVCIANITFVNGQSNEGGGAINWGGQSGTLINSTFINNQNDVGGAIYWAGHDGHLSNCIFENNTATRDGGAICWGGGDSHLSNCIFENNTATRDGGAILWTGDSGELINSTFINNNAKDWGGAIYWTGSDGQLSNCIFENNTANRKGSALYVNGENFRILSSLYTNNVVTNPISAWDDGGAIYTDGINNLVANSTFISNKAINSYGGAIYIRYGTATLDSNIFMDNFALRGTSIYLDKAQCAVNNIFYLNSIDDIASCVEEVNLSEIFDLNTFMVNGKVVSKDAYFNNETKPYAILMASDVVTGYGDGELVAVLSDVNGNAIVGGKVKFIVGDITHFIWTDSSGRVCLNISSLKPGNYSARIKYLGNEYYEAVTTTANVIVNKGVSQLAATDVVANYGDGELVAVLSDVNGNAIVGGKVKFIVGDITHFIWTDSEGKVSLDISSLKLGNYSARIKYLGNNDYLASSTAASVVVNKGVSQLVATDVVTGYGDGELVAVLSDVNGNAIVGGKVKFIVGDITHFIWTDSQGKVSLDISTLTPGNYSARIKYLGNNDYLASSTIANVFVRDKSPSQLTASDIVVGYGDGELVAILTDVNGNAIAGGKVKFIVGDITEFIWTDSHGKVSLNISTLTPGSYSARIRYLGNDYYESTSTTANVVVKSTVLLTADDVVTNYGNGHLVAVLSDVNGNAIIGGKVKFIVGDITEFIWTDSEGKVSLDISSLSPGNYSARIKYMGNNDYLASSIIANVVVRDKVISQLTTNNLSIEYGGYASLFATLTDINGNPISDADVIVDFNGVNYTLTTIDGIAQLSVGDLNPGYYAAVFSFTGNDFYLPSSAVANVAVNKSVSQLSVIDIYINYGDSGSLVANLTDIWGNAIGDVDVVVDFNGFNYTLAAVDGMVQLSVGGLNPGYYAVVFSFAGNDFYLPSSAVANVMVNKSSSQLSVNDIYINYGDSGSFVATLTDIGGNAIGNATIYVYTTYNETYVFITDDEGKAYLSINNLELGSYSIYINFEGNDFYFESNAVANIFVNKASSEWDLNEPFYFYYGEQNYLTAALKDVNGNPIANVSTTLTFVNWDTAEYYASYTCVTNNEGMIYVNTNDLGANTYYVTYNFAGNSYYESSWVSHSIIVRKCPTYFIMNNGFDSASYQENKWWSIKLIKLYNPVASDGDGIGNADVRITFTEISNQRQYVFDLKTSSNSQDYGYAKLNTQNMLPGVYSITVNYFGDSNYSETDQYYDHYTHSISYLRFTINKANPTITTAGVTTTYGTEKYVSAVLKDYNGNVMANRWLTFTFEDGTGRTVRTDNNGKAQISTSGIVAGTHTITVTYTPESGSDDNNIYNSVSSSVTMKINKADAILYAKTGSTWIINKMGQKVGPLQMQSGKEEEIQIYVEDSNGNPVVGKTVRLELNSYVSSKSVITDSNGVATFKQTFYHTFSVANPQPKTFTETFTLIDDCYKEVSITVDVSVSGA